MSREPGGAGPGEGGAPRAVPTEGVRTPRGATASGRGVHAMATIRVSIGVCAGDDPLRAVQGAATAARAAAGAEAPEAALVLVAGPRGTAPAAAVRECLGPVPLGGARAVAIATDAGLLTSGAAVVCFHGAGLAPAAACAGSAATALPAATDRVGRLMLSGAPDRRHYPRGLALAFARPSGESLAQGFLARWRQITGPKLRTVASATAGELFHGPSLADPGLLSVLCVEGAYQSGVGVASGFAAGESIPDATVLVHGAADAASTAVKRLEGHHLRAALIVESAERRAALGSAAADEWAAVREQIGSETPCLGWLASAECGYGRGVLAEGETGSMIIAALADAPAPAPEVA